MKFRKVREVTAALFALVLVIIVIGIASQVFGWNIPLLTPFMNQFSGE